MECAKQELGLVEPSTLFPAFLSQLDRKILDGTGTTWNWKKLKHTQLCEEALKIFKQLILSLC